MKRLGVLLAFLAVAALCAELTARFLIVPSEALVWRPLPPFDGLWTREQKAWLAAQQGGGDLAGSTGTFDAELGWSVRPNVASRDGSVHTDALGRRTLRSYPVERPEGTRRIVACGDSFTWADEVADGEGWCARLEEAHPDWEVWNWGVGGYGTDQALLRLRREMVAAGRGPVDAVLVGLMIENIGRNVNRYRPRWHSSSLPAAKPRFVLDARGGLELLPQPYATREAFVAAVASGAVLADLAEHEYWIDDHLPRGLEWSSIGQLLGGRRAYRARDLAPLWQDTAGEPFRLTLAILEAFREVAAALEAPHLVVLVFPTREALQGKLEHGPAYWSTALDALAARGIAALDLTEPLEASARAPGSGGVRTLFRESHLSPRGNERVAGVVGAWLEARFAGR